MNITLEQDERFTQLTSVMNTVFAGDKKQSLIFLKKCLVSDLHFRFDPVGTDCFHQNSVIAFVLIRISHSKINQGFLE